MQDGEASIQATETSFDIIERIKVRNGAGVTELATDLDMAKSTVHKHLYTLCNRGYVKNEGNKYQISPRFLDLGIYARNRDPVYQVAKEKIDELTNKTEEKVWLIIEEQGRSIHLYGGPGKYRLRTYARVGQLTYLHQLAAGKAILAHFTNEHINEIVDKYGLPAQTQHTISSRKQLFEEIAQIREQGYATNIEETVHGLHSLGVPIQDINGNPLAGISVSGPANRIRKKRRKNIILNTLKNTANEIEINIEES